MASKLDAYKDLLGDMTDEKLVELTGLKLATVKAYRAKHAAELGKAITEVAELTGTDPGELEEAPAEATDGAVEVTLVGGLLERDILAEMLKKSGFAATDENIDELLKTDSPEEATALMLSWHAGPAGPEEERIPYSFSTTQTINIPGPRGRVQKIGKSIFRGERAASVWAQLSPEDREKRTAGHCYEPPKGGR